MVFEREVETSKFEMDVLWKKEEVEDSAMEERSTHGAQFVIDDDEDEEEDAREGSSNPLPIPSRKPKQTLPSLAERLFSCLIDLLFCCGFTLPTKIQVDHYKINYVIWWVCSTGIMLSLLK